MVHQPSGGFQGKASDIERHAEDIIKTKRRLNELYAKHCGRTYEEVERTLDRDDPGGEGVHAVDDDRAVESPRGQRVGELDPKICKTFGPIGHGWLLRFCSKN